MATPINGASNALPVYTVKKGEAAGHKQKTDAAFSTLKQSQVMTAILNALQPNMKNLGSVDPQALVKQVQDGINKENIGIGANDTDQKQLEALGAYLANIPGGESLAKTLPNAIKGATFVNKAVADNSQIKQGAEALGFKQTEAGFVGKTPEEMKANGATLADFLTPELASLYAGGVAGGKDAVASMFANKDLAQASKTQGVNNSNWMKALKPQEKQALLSIAEKVLTPEGFENFKTQLTNVDSGYKSNFEAPVGGTIKDPTGAKDPTMLDSRLFGKLVMSPDSIIPKGVIVGGSKKISDSKDGTQGSGIVHGQAIIGKETTNNGSAAQITGAIGLHSSTLKVGPDGKPYAVGNGEAGALVTGNIGAHTGSSTTITPVMVGDRQVGAIMGDTKETTGTTVGAGVYGFLKGSAYQTAHGKGSPLYVGGVLDTAGAQLMFGGAKGNVFGDAIFRVGKDGETKTQFQTGLQF
jgi:hypothetical protein